MPLRRSSALALFLALVIGLTLTQTRSADSQILLVSGEYRVVELDKANQRVGVALPEAQPDIRQNWIYLQANTEIIHHQQTDDGWHKDERMTYDGFFNAAKPGRLMRVQGGRRWDGGITAKRIKM